jgi:hypothetical protein
VHKREISINPFDCPRDMLDQQAARQPQQGGVVGKHADHANCSNTVRGPAL